MLIKSITTRETCVRNHDEYPQQGVCATRSEGEPWVGIWVGVEVGVEVGVGASCVVCALWVMCMAVTSWLAVRGSVQLSVEDNVKF